MVEKQHHLFRSPTDPGKDQFLVSWVVLCLEQDFLISHVLQPKELGMLPSHPAWGRGVYRGGRWWVTRGSYSLFPASFAAKIHHFFSVFPVETSSILTITTVPWVCARLFAGMRRWLRGESRAGTATNDLLFPSGKAERRSVWRWRGRWCVPHSWGAGASGSGSAGGKKWAGRATCMAERQISRVHTGAVPG